MRLTKNQRRVLAALRRANRPLGAYELLERLRSEGFGAATQIYRALDPLLEQDLVHRIESVKGYVASSCPDECQHSHMAFTVCDICGRHDEFATEEVEDMITAGVDKAGFVPASTTIELHGACPDCAHRVDRSR